MGEEVEEPLNSSNLINRLQLFKEKLVLQPPLLKMLAETVLGSFFPAVTLSLWINDFFKNIYFFNAPLRLQTGEGSLKMCADCQSK